MTPRELDPTTGALTRLRRLSAVISSSASSATAHAPGVGGIQLYGGPYGWVRAGLGLGSTPLSFSLRWHILSEMRNFEDVDGVDITRRCWDSSDKQEDNGTGESVRRGEGNESAKELLRFEVRDSEAGDGSDSGGGRARLESAAVGNNKARFRKKYN
jgi:hypothetical protein